MPYLVLKNRAEVNSLKATTYDMLQHPDLIQLLGNNYFQDIQYPDA